MKLSLTSKNWPPGTALIPMASGLERNAVENIRSEWLKACSVRRSSSPIRRCFSLVSRRRAAERMNEAVTAIHAIVICSAAMRLPMKMTSKGMRIGKAWEKAIVRNRDPGSEAGTSSS